MSEESEMERLKEMLEDGLDGDVKETARIIWGGFPEIKDPLGGIISGGIVKISKTYLKFKLDVENSQFVDAPYQIENKLMFISERASSLAKELAGISDEVIDIIGDNCDYFDYDFLGNWMRLFNNMSKDYRPRQNELKRLADDLKKMSEIASSYKESKNGKRNSGLRREAVKEYLLRALGGAISYKNRSDKHVLPIARVIREWASPEEAEVSSWGERLFKNLGSEWGSWNMFGPFNNEAAEPSKPLSPVADPPSAAPVKGCKTRS